MISTPHKSDRRHENEEWAEFMKKQVCPHHSDVDWDEHVAWVSHGGGDHTRERMIINSKETSHSQIGVPQNNSKRSVFIIPLSLLSMYIQIIYSCSISEPNSISSTRAHVREEGHSLY